MKPTLRRMLIASLAVARAYASNRKKTSSLLDAAERKSLSGRGLAAKFGSQLNEIVRLVRAWVRGRYRVVPWKSIVLFLAALLYFVNPLDLIPDIVPLLGFTDDATVVAFVLSSLRKDVERFREWEMEHARYGVATFPD